jgi:fructose-bisphosphate aldolase class 1
MAFLISEDGVSTVHRFLAASNALLDADRVVFLSGGQATVDAMRRLEEMRNAAIRKGFPYAVSSSFSRALQGPALEEFGAAVRNRGTVADIKRRTQAKFAETLKLNGTALNKSAKH